MNIHLVDSLAPMQSEPLGRPDKCPACGETKFTDKHPRNFEHRVFECGAYYEFENKKWWGECKRAFAAAFSLQSAPLGRPDKCPACGETKVRYDTGKLMEFVCGCIVGVDGSGADDCSFAFAAAVSLREERDAARRANDVFRHNNMIQSSEIITLMAQLDAARAEVARETSECGHDARLFIQSSIFGWTRDENELRVEDSGCLMCYTIELEAERDSALARAAELQARLGAVTEQAEKLAKKLEAITCHDGGGCKAYWHADDERRLGETAAPVVFNQQLPRITDVRCKCFECGWKGTVGECEPDVDGDGGLGCPKCNHVVETFTAAPAGKETVTE